MVEEAPPPTRPCAERKKEHWWKRNDAQNESCALQPRPGHICPACGEGILAYDGLFLLTCGRCGFVAEGGAFT